MSTEEIKEHIDVSMGDMYRVETKNSALASDVTLPSKLSVNTSIRVNNSRTFIDAIEVNIKNTKRYYKLTVDVANSIWVLMQDLVHCVPPTLGFIIQICRELILERNEEDVRKLVYHILIEQLLAKFLNDPIKNKIIDGCTIPSNYFDTVTNICKILRGLILNKRILPQELISQYANSFITNSQ